MAKKSPTLSSIQKAKFYDEGNFLPKCINIGCDNDVAVRDWKYWSFKSECSSCAKSRIDKKYLIESGERVIIRNDNRILIHKKEYCENNGSLGFQCPVPRNGWVGFGNSLDLDHKDGDHQNNEPENVKTYCKLCHGRKSLESGDCNSHKTSSRKFN